MNSRLLGGALVLGSVAFAVAGPSAASAATHAKPAFSLNISPARIPAGGPGAVRHITLTNEGSKPVSIHGSVQNVVGTSGHCALGQASDWAKLSLTSFVLPPGKHREVTLTLKRVIPSGDSGLVAVFSSAPPKTAHTTGAVVVGAVGSQMQTHSPGPTAKQACSRLTLPKASAPSASGGLPLLPLGLAAVAVVLLGLVVTLVVRSRPRGSHRGA